MPHSTQPRAVVTGGNRGLGLEVSRQLAAQGYRVLLTARSDEAARQAAHDVASSGAVQAAQLDVTSHDSIAAFAKQLGPIDALVNNAGVSLNGFDANVVRGTMAVNFFGALHVTQALAPLLKDGGCVVMVSSGMGELSAFTPALRARFLDPLLKVEQLAEFVHEFEQSVGAGTHTAQGWPSSAYRVSKAALNALTRVWAQQSDRLHVNAVCPGWVQTDMGGKSAPRSVVDGARGIVWAATLKDDGPHGGFFRDQKPIPW